jgi:hypothetical protein
MCGGKGDEGGVSGEGRGEAVNKSLDLIVNQSPGATVPLFDPNAQRDVAFGIILFLLCWGIAKIIKAWRQT